MSEEYQAYLFRFQRSGAHTHWRVYVENAETGEVWRFASEWELFRFLLDVLAVTPTGSYCDTEIFDTPHSLAQEEIEGTRTDA